MKKLYILLLVFYVLLSCNATKRLIGKTYVYRSKKRTLSLIFENDTICKLKNTFHCKDIDIEIRELVIICKYQRINNKIFLKNLKCKSDTCNYGLSVSIPIQNSKKCDFLNEEHRIKRNTIGPKFTSKYDKYGLIPAIDIDTLYVQKNKIILYKQDRNESIGFVFK